MSFVLAVNIRIKPENVDSFMQLLRENARDARKEPGCRQFDVLVDPKDRTKVMLYEVYNDERRSRPPADAALQEIPRRGSAAACLARAPGVYESRNPPITPPAARNQSGFSVVTRMPIAVSAAISHSRQSGVAPAWRAPSRPRGSSPPRSARSRAGWRGAKAIP